PTSHRPCVRGPGTSPGKRPRRRARHAEHRGIPPEPADRDASTAPRTPPRRAHSENATAVVRRTDPQRCPHRKGIRFVAKPEPCAWPPWFAAPAECLISFIKTAGPPRGTTFLEDQERPLCTVAGAGPAIHRGIAAVQGSWWMTRPTASLSAFARGWAASPR